jgi:hypothetical protein
MNGIEKIRPIIKEVYKILPIFFIGFSFIFLNHMETRLLLKFVILGCITIFFTFLLKFKSVYLNCNNKCYSLKCHQRKMLILRNLNNRIFEKVLKEDEKVEKNKFLISKSFYTYMGIMKFFSIIHVVCLRVSIKKNLK